MRKNIVNLDLDKLIEKGIPVETIVEQVKKKYAEADASRDNNSALEAARNAVAASMLDWYKALGTEFRSKEDEDAMRMTFSKILQIMEKDIQKDISKPEINLSSFPLFF